MHWLLRFYAGKVLMKTIKIRKHLSLSCLSVVSQPLHLREQMSYAKIQLFAKSWISSPFVFCHWLACLSISNNLQYLGYTHLTVRSWLILGLPVRQPFTQCPLLPIAQYIWLGMINTMVYVWLQSPCQLQQLKCVNISHCL